MVILNLKFLLIIVKSHNINYNIVYMLLKTINDMIF